MTDERDSRDVSETRAPEAPGMPRRAFIRTVAGAAAGSALGAVPVGRMGIGGLGRLAGGDGPAGGSVAAPTAARASLVDPLIGTGWHGHTYPGPTAPFGLVQPGPDSQGPKRPWYDWDHCSGYHYRDSVLTGFTHTHLQGTGGQDLGDVLLMPVVEGRNWAWEAGTPGAGYCSRYTHEHEEAATAYYRLDLDTPGVTAELTATTRCALHRYTYPARAAGARGRRGLLLDLAHGLGCTVYHAELKIEGPTTLSGCRYTHGWAADRRVFFVIELSQPVAESAEFMVDGASATAGARDLNGKEIKARFTLPAERRAGADTLLVRVGISGTSVEGARLNLAAEIPDWDFERVRHETEAVWERGLERLDAELPSEGLERVFYTGVYHSLTSPTSFNDVDDAYRGQDGKTYRGADFTKYTTLSIWDIYRGEFPFLMLVQPGVVNDIVRTTLADYRELGQHSLPMWPLWGNETWTMTGFHVAGMILGAYTRGFRSWDVEAVYAAMRDTAMVGATANGNYTLQKQFRDLGYVATGPHKESVSHTLDFAYDYWCVGAMAQLLGKQDDAAYFMRLAGNYRNLFDPKTGFMRGKTEDGHWREPFRPDQETTDDYTESDAWQATFNVMQDVQGLIELYGGDEAFIAKLDALFTAPSKVLDAPPDITGLIGQDAQGNEPSNHIPYLYSFAGAPWKTQRWARAVMEKWYIDTPRGLPGNDDCGQLSSWLVMGALGFYPVNAATGVYVLGSPLVRRATIRSPEAGTTFTIVAEGNGPGKPYVQSLEVNGRRTTRSWITHADLVRGGEMVFRMGAKPNREWGAAPEDRPPSGLIPEGT